MLKFRKEKDMYIITYNGREILFQALHDAIEYIFYQKFFALMDGKMIGYHNDTLYPVHSLLPPIVVKTVKFFDLGVEIC